LFEKGGGSHELWSTPRLGHVVESGYHQSIADFSHMLHAGPVYPRPGSAHAAGGSENVLWISYPRISYPPPQPAVRAGGREDKKLFSASPPRRLSGSQEGAATARPLHPHPKALQSTMKKLAGILFVLLIAVGVLGNLLPTSDDLENAEEERAAPQAEATKRSSVGEDLGGVTGVPGDRSASEDANNEELKFVKFDRIVSLFAEHGIHASSLDDKIEDEVGFRDLRGYIQPVSESKGSRHMDGEVVSFDLSPSVAKKYVGKIVEFTADYEERGFFETVPNLSDFKVVGTLSEADFDVKKCIYRPCGGKGRYQSTYTDVIRGTCESCKKEEAIRRRSEGFTYQYCIRCCNALNLSTGISTALVKEKTEWVDCSTCGGSGSVVGARREPEVTSSEEDVEVR
jgi:hypothetical protein